MYFNFFGENSPEIDPEFGYDLTTGEGQCLLYMIAQREFDDYGLLSNFECSIIKRVKDKLGGRLNFKSTSGTYELFDIECDLWQLRDLPAEKYMDFFREHGAFCPKFYFSIASDICSEVYSYIGLAYIHSSGVDRDYLLETYREMRVKESVFCGAYNAVEASSTMGWVCSSSYKLMLAVSDDVEQKYYNTRIDISGSDKKLDKRTLKLEKYLALVSRTSDDIMLWNKDTQHSFRVFTVRPIYQVLPKLKDKRHWVVRLSE